MTTHEVGKLRVMVDANILIAGTGWPRFPYEVLQHAVLGDFQLVLCPYIIAEARRHIDRVILEMRAQFEQILATCQFEEVPNPSLAQVEANADLVRDVKDIPVALAAINAQVDCLVTQDRDFTEGSERLRQQLDTLLPGTFLREHMGWTSDALEAIRNRTWNDFEE